VTILVGDVGGTYTRLALFDNALVELDVYPTGPSVSLEQLIRSFLAKHDAVVDRVAFGVAAAVRDGRSIESTNLPWPVDAQNIARAARVERVLLLNDVEACAHGIGSLGPGDLATLTAGGPHSTGNRVVISVGTGLGQAGLYWDGERHHAFTSEGGYSDFAPRDKLEESLRAWLAEQHGHVSYERVCSGFGLVEIHRYLTGDVVSPERITGSALDIMVSVLGAFAGNAALNLLATGGVYLAGGIPPRILPRLRIGRFVAAFVDKGILRSVLEQIPVHVILSDRVALLGAATLARERPTDDRPV
jgi:glucokinase